MFSRSHSGVFLGCEEVRRTTRCGKMWNSSRNQNIQRSKIETRRAVSQYHRATPTAGYSWKDIEKEPYFHGHLPRQDSLRRLLRDGEFLVRTTDVANKERVIISVNVKNQAMHFIVEQTPNGEYYVDRKRIFKTVTDMIVFHYLQKIPLTPKSQAKLLRPVSLPVGEFGVTQIVLTYTIGQGRFGDTWKARLQYGSPKNMRNVEVAVKKAKKNPKTSLMTHLIKDYQKWRHYNHPNVLKFYGISLVHDKIMLISELAKESLLTHLRRDGLYLISLKDRLRYCLEAAKGMEYLEKQECMHNDIGARNCLMDSGKRLKIADYGIQESEVSEELNIKAKTPIKWQAPETIITSVYTFQTDIWSFGILLWEIFSDGLVPYPGMSNTEVSKKVALEQHRMTPPDGCPDLIASLITECFGAPGERPDFKTIRGRIDAGTKRTFMR